MSRPPPPLPQPQSTPKFPVSDSRNAMTETQRAPTFPPLSFLGDSLNRHIPQPIRLPPLHLPREHRPIEDPFLSSNFPPVPPARSAHASATPQYRQSPSPVDAYPPQRRYSPPRAQRPYSPPQYIQSGYSNPEAGSFPTPRLVEARRPYEERRPISREQASVAPPARPYRSAYGALPSASFANAPAVHSTAYREVATPSHGPRSSSFHASAAGEPSPSTARPAPGTPPLPRRGQAGTFENLYHVLSIRQQPRAARACGFGERDRRVIDPPPIVQLTVTNVDTGVQDTEELRYCYNVVHCTLWNAEGTHEETALMQPERRSTRRLMGQLVASPSIAKDENDAEGCFFIFPDLSCRTNGRYRLRFVLMRVDPLNLNVGGFSPILTDVYTDVFTVYTAKEFPGMQSSSALTRALKLQGINVQVKKGNHKTFLRRRLAQSEEEEEIQDDGDAKGKRRRKD